MKKDKIKIIITCLPYTLSFNTFGWWSNLICNARSSVIWNSSGVLGGKTLDFQNFKIQFSKIQDPAKKKRIIKMKKMKSKGLVYRKCNRNWQCDTGYEEERC